MKRSLFLISLFAALFFSCQNPARWYPEAEVSVSHTEYTDQTPSAKALVVTLLIHNSGDTTIVSSTVTVKARTDKREYLHTISSALRIIPGGTVALTASIPYLEIDEQLKADGVSVYDAFFE
jgi:copper(I)-binding protein